MTQQSVKFASNPSASASRRGASPHACVYPSRWPRRRDNINLRSRRILGASLVIVLALSYRRVIADRTASRSLPHAFLLYRASTEIGDPRVLRRLLSTPTMNGRTDFCAHAGRRRFGTESIPVDWRLLQWCSDRATARFSIVFIFIIE